MAVPYTITGFGDSSSFVISINVSLRRVLRLLSRIPGYRLIESKGWWLTDDYYRRFRLGEYEFEIETPLSDYIISAAKPGCPMEVFEKVNAALDAPESWWSRLF